MSLPMEIGMGAGNGRGWGDNRIGNAG